MTQHTDDAVWSEWEHTKDTPAHDIYDRGATRIEVYDDREEAGWRSLAYVVADEARERLADAAFEDSEAARAHARRTAERLDEERF